MEAIILIGIQGAGKSLFYQQRFADTHVRINLDMLKTRRRERILLEACLAARQSFVVDNTNVTAADRARYIAPAKAAGFRVVGYYFAATLSSAIERNRQRLGRRAVPDKAIAGTLKRLARPRYEEGFDALFVVSIGADLAFTVTEWHAEV